MSQKGARDADRLSFADEKGVNGLVSTGCFWISREMSIIEAILKTEKKKRHHICHLSYSMSNSDYSLYFGSLVMQLISNLVVRLCMPARICSNEPKTN